MAIVNIDAKYCSRCRKLKNYIDFGINKTRKDGYNNQCKSCYHEAYLKRSAGSKRYTKFNGTKEEYTKQYFKQHYKNNKAYYRNKCAVRERNLAKQTPKWCNKFFIEEFYDLAQRRTASTGIKWEVDHIVPLKSDLVSGLHVEHNLQVVPASWNRSKSNTWDCEIGGLTWRL